MVSDQISRSVVSDSLRPHESQHARRPCPSPTPGVVWQYGVASTKSSMEAPQKQPEKGCLSLVAQVVKNPPAMWETWVWSLGREDPLEEAMATHSVFWPGESHGQRSLVPCSPWGHKESDRTERLSTARDSSGGSGRGVTCLHRRPLVCWVTSRRTPLSPRQCCFWFWVYAVSEFCCLDTCYSDKTGDLSKVWAHMQIPSCLTMLQLRQEESSFQWHRQAPDGGVLPLPRSRKLSLNLSLDYVPLYLPV